MKQPDLIKVDMIHPHHNIYIPAILKQTHVLHDDHMSWFSNLAVPGIGTVRIILQNTEIMLSSEVKFP